jgi:two-component system, cell cycle sensor histidine kinase and response regulator CckA
MRVYLLRIAVIMLLLISIVLPEAAAETRQLPVFNSYHTGYSWSATLSQEESARMSTSDSSVTLFETNGMFMTAILLSFAVLMALVILLGISVIRMRRAKEALMLTKLCVDQSPNPAKKMEDELRESERRLAEIIDFLPDATFAVDAGGKIIIWNHAMEDMTGIKSEDMLGKGNYEHALPIYGSRRPMLIDIVMSPDEEIAAKYHSIRQFGEGLTAESSVTALGRERYLWGKAVPLRDSHGRISGCIEIVRDITEQKDAELEHTKLQELLFQSQKMETIGLLAGGVAHDFNNLLTPILGYSEILLIGLPGADPRRLMIEQIQQCAERAKDLTKRLLAFSRKQVLELKVFNMGDIVSEFRPVIKSALCDNIKIVMDIDPQSGLVRADKAQIEQALLNLVVNARDAMPEGGLLTIEVKNFDVDESYAGLHAGVPTGSYVMLSVTDTGSGIDEETQKHIFEPFFTTKQLGRGTGLGLATVYGIVKQHGGHISVYSEKNRGSVFKAFLPMVTREGQRIGYSEHKRSKIFRGSETVLLMEDDDAVRAFACRVLVDLGYNVLMAESVEDCIEIARNHAGPIDLLLTDVIMPEKNGKELYELLKCEYPFMKALYMSGYSNNVIGHHGIIEGGINFLHKPFTITDLSNKIREALES